MKDEKEGLVRVLGVRDAVGVGLGAIIGAGIFVVTGVAAGVAGPSFLVGLMIAGLIATCNALSSAQLAAFYPQSGGTYEYGYRLLSPGFGFSAGWMFLVSKLSAAGVVAIGFGNYFHQLVQTGSPVIYSVFAVVVLTMANYYGIKKAGTLNLAIVAVAIFALLYFSISAAQDFDSANFRPFMTGGFYGMAESAALLFFAFTGYARIATLAEEVRDPRRTIPKAVIITIITAIVLYLLVGAMAVGAAGTEVLSTGFSPLENVADGLSTPGVKVVVVAGACAAMLGVLLSQVLGISRMFYAMGKRRDVPSVFEKVNPKHHVPAVGIFVTGGIVLLLVLLGSVEFIVRAATFTILLYYSITNIAALRQPKEERLYGKFIPWLGLTGCLAMASSLPVSVILSGLAILLVGFMLRYFFRNFQKA